MRSATGEIHENGKRVSEILLEMRSEFIDFVETRITMLRAEFQEKGKAAKRVLPLAAVAALLLGTAYLLLVAALVGLVLAAFPQSVYRWFFACIIVGISWGILGAAAAYFAKREFDAMSLKPDRTLEVLKGDKLWFNGEVRNRI